MAQPSVAAFFTNRKRAALDDAISIKNRVRLPSQQRDSRYKSICKDVLPIQAF